MAEAARKALSSVVHFFSVDWNRGAPQPLVKNEPVHRVGEYYADYSELTQAELHAPQPDLDGLFKDSRVVSVKRES